MHKFYFENQCWMVPVIALFLSVLVTIIFGILGNHK